MRFRTGHAIYRLLVETTLDQYAYGDIRYACEEPVRQQADRFIGPTRVVGRLPDVTGGTESRISNWFA